MHRSEIGLLTPFAKTTKSGGIINNKVRESGGKNLKINERVPSCIKDPKV